MAEEMPDRRRARTRAALHSAFVELLMEQGYEAVKVGAIAERANIGRSTLYEHYRTKHELLRASLAAPFALLARLADCRPDQSAPQAELHALLQHFREHGQVARVLLGWPTRPLLAQTLAQLVGEQLARATGRAPCALLGIVAAQIADAQLALIDSWVRGRPGLGIELAAHTLRRSSLALAQLVAD
jgi:AcrR family transcriptional regulator